MREYIIRQLISLSQQLIKIMQDAERNQTESSIKLFTTAKAGIGRNWCKNYALGCAETVNGIYRAAFGIQIGGNASTFLMYGALRDPNRFLKVYNPLPGDIVISPSGYGKFPHGHVGIVGEGEAIMSNDSATGKLQSNYTFDSWHSRYAIKGGFPVEYFRPI